MRENIWFLKSRVCMVYGVIDLNGGLNDKLTG